MPIHRKFGLKKTFIILELESHKSRTQIRERVSKPMSGILFGIILKTPILELNGNIKWHINYFSYPFLVPLLCQIIPPSNYDIIHSTEPWWVWDRLKTHMVSRVEIAHIFYCVTMSCGLSMVVHSCCFFWEGLTYPDTWGQMCLPRAGNVTYFKEALLCANICPHPTPFLAWSCIFQKRLAYESQAEKAFA